MSERLFSYGTLRDAPVQRRLFGRLVPGVSDAVMGYRLAKITIADPAAIATSGKAEHLIIDLTGRREDVVEGQVLELTPEELRIADVYEDVAYKRVRAPLRSGQGECWVYIRA
ncbi:MAG TPA: gamma-glutamylcyclotransferase family protein [Rhizomicrobium sp.]|nr:gamma-glutamylcyclotransferase family protein [Rhizomicrobium sp.]